MQLLGNLFEYALREDGGRAQYPRRDLRRHRHRRRIRDARQARHPRLHAVAATENEPVPDGADVLAAGPEHPQPRDRRRVRRLPGHRQGVSATTSRSRPLQDRHGQFDQLGARGGAGRLLLQGLLRRPRRANDAAGRSRCRRATSATSAPATSRADGAADPPADRSRPTRTTCSTSSSAPASTACARPPRRTRPQPVDGHLEGVELRALRLRPGRPRWRRGVRALWQQVERDGGFDLGGDAAFRARRAVRFRLGPQHARRPPGHDPRCRSRATASIDRYAYRRRHQGRAASTAKPGVPLICLETALPAKFAAAIARGARPRA